MTELKEKEQSFEEKIWDIRSEQARSEVTLARLRHKDTNYRFFELEIVYWRCICKIIERFRDQE